jgi:thiol-disulfide isomerase/thioredoxin
MAGKPYRRMIAAMAAFVAAAVMLPCLGLAQPEVAPDFRADRCFMADSLTLSDFSGSPVVLFFFDAGDVACFDTYPYVINWHKKYAADEVKVIGIHCPFYEPLRMWSNAITAIARTDLTIPVAMDLDRKIYDTYSLDGVPSLLLLDPEMRIVAAAFEEEEYRGFEEEIHALLKTIEPDVILPFLFEPETPKGGDAKYPDPTPRITLGYDSGSIVNADSAAYDQFARYTDPGNRDRGKAYLGGRWKLEDSLATYEPGESAHIRVIYSGKDVWLLPSYDLAQTVSVFVEQDRQRLPDEIWGRDIKLDRSDRTFIYMRYAVPMHIVRNPAYGTHELKLIPEAGNLSFLYLFFQSPY